MITSETTLGTICHNDDSASDADHRRVEIWVDEDGVIWADRDNPQNGMAPKADSIDKAVKYASELWGGPQWDFQLADVLNA